MIFNFCQCKFSSTSTAIPFPSPPSSLFACAGIVTGTLIYFCSGLKSYPNAFVLFLLVLWLFAETAAAFAEVLTSLIRSTTAIMLAFVTLFALQMMFTGYLAPVSTIPLSMFTPPSLLIINSIALSNFMCVYTTVWRPIFYLSFFR